MPRHAFTFEYSSRQRSIITPCNLTDPLDPSVTPYTGNALWDTGATFTVIDPEVSKYLNLVPTGRVVSRGIHATAIVNRYFVNIKLDDEVVIHDLKVVEANLEHGLDVLIGMDIIVKGEFLIRRGKAFSFEIPSFDTPR